MLESPLVSIIITSYTADRLQDIFKLLDSIEAQTYPRTETLFVAERSKELYDKLESYAKAKSGLHMRVIFNEGEPGASSARNLGIKQAKGEIIAFIDDDTVLFPDWAEEMVKTYERESIVGVTGPAFPLWQDGPVPWIPEEFYWLFSCTSWCEWREISDVRNVWTMNASFRREAFTLGGLFSPSIGPRSGSMSGRKRDISEDVELSLRVRQRTGKRIVYNPNARVKHRVYKDRTRFGYIIQWSYWVGFSKHKLKKLYPPASKDEDLLSQEHQLLKRIFTKLLPNIFWGMFKDPIISFRKLWVTITVLVFVTLGYSFSSLKSLFERQESTVG